MIIKVKNQSGKISNLSKIIGDDSPGLLALLQYVTHPL